MATSSQYSNFKSIVQQELARPKNILREGVKVVYLFACEGTFEILTQGDGRKHKYATMGSRANYMHRHTEDVQLQKTRGVIKKYTGKE